MNSQACPRPSQQLRQQHSGPTCHPPTTAYLDSEGGRTVGAKVKPYLRDGVVGEEGGKMGWVVVGVLWVSVEGGAGRPSSCFALLALSRCFSVRMLLCPECQPPPAGCSRTGRARPRGRCAAACGSWQSGTDSLAAAAPSGAVEGTGGGGVAQQHERVNGIAVGDVSG